MFRGNFYDDKFMLEKFDVKKLASDDIEYIKEYLTFRRSFLLNLYAQLPVEKNASSLVYAYSGECSVLLGSKLPLYQIEEIERKFASEYESLKTERIKLCKNEQEQDFYVSKEVEKVQKDKYGYIACEMQFMQDLFVALNHGKNYPMFTYSLNEELNLLLDSEIEIEDFSQDFSKKLKSINFENNSEENKTKRGYIPAEEFKTNSICFNKANNWLALYATQRYPLIHFDDILGCYETELNLLRYEGYLDQKSKAKHMDYMRQRLSVCLATTKFRDDMKNKMKDLSGCAVAHYLNTCCRMKKSFSENWNIPSEFADSLIDISSKKLNLFLNSECNTQKKYVLKKTFESFKEEMEYAKHKREMLEHYYFAGDGTGDGFSGGKRPSKDGKSKELVKTKRVLPNS